MVTERVPPLWWDTMSVGHWVILLVWGVAVVALVAAFIIELWRLKK